MEKTVDEIEGEEMEFSFSSEFKLTDSDHQYFSQAEHPLNHVQDSRKG